MKMFCLLLILCLASCVQTGYESKDFFKNFFTEYENTIGKETASKTVYEKVLEKDHQNSPEITVAYAPQNGIIESCNITFTFSDFLEVKQYYNKLHDFIKNNWDFVKPVSKYKQPNGELYSKNGIYLEIYEPVYFVIPLSFSRDIDHNDFPQYCNQPEMIYDIGYYKTEIIKYRNFFDERQQMSAIEKIDNSIPGLLCFLVCWDDNLKGYMYELYAFDEKHTVVNKYLVGYGPKINNIGDILMEKLPGTRIGHELISFGDFNNDGSNEIVSYSFYPNLGYVFAVFGYRLIENEFSHACLIPIYINFENPFSPVEFTKNGFKILEVIDNEYLELAWNEYKWNTDTEEYLRK